MLQEQSEKLKKVEVQEKKVFENELQKQLEARLKTLKEVPEEKKKYATFITTLKEPKSTLDPALESKYNQALQKQMLFQDRIKKIAITKQAKKMKRELNDDSESSSSDDDFYSDDD